MSRRTLPFTRPGSLALILVAMAACGSVIDDPQSSSNGTGGASTTGNGTGGGGNGGNGNGGAGAGGGCEGLGHVACVAAFPACVPAYDDVCCPMCDPTGNCADCVNWQFHHCTTPEEACLPEMPTSCGVTPGWACTGGIPSCADPGGSPTPCGTVPGCVLGACNVDVDCDPPEYCVPVVGQQCVATCPQVPPECPAGMQPEVKGSCFTGDCITAALCATP